MDWIATLINGALLGGLYGLFGLGLALVFGVMRVINLAHGEFIVAGAYLGVFLVASMPQVPPWLMIVPVALAGYALGFGLQAGLVNRAVRSARASICWASRACASAWRRCSCCCWPRRCSHCCSGCCGAPSSAASCVPRRTRPRWRG
jgi:hypothetical protein